MPIPRAASTASRLDAVHGDVGVRQHRRHGEHDERDEHVREARSRRSASPNAITARLGSARPTLPTLIARNEPRCRWPSQTPSGIAISERDRRSPRRRGAGARASCRATKRRVVDDERERVDEDAEARAARSRGPPRRRPRRERALSEHEQPRRRRSRAATASTPAAMNSVLKNVCSASRIGCPSPSGSTNAAIVARLIVVTVAIRMPGDDRGQRERQLDAQQRLRPRQAHPRVPPRAPPGGTLRRPARMFRNRISSV